ncbi:tetratricopeptide repeat protein [Hyphomonas sp. NPDC076900]|uniref:tetratricopeptide repeat protein n=1 Tax=unclassified Hyphomonas TaxID=2630699 RepID=UPI003D07850E
MHKFWQELKRRNVFRVASIYAVVGWLLMQLGVVLESTLLLPGWFDTMITVVVLLGFPIALILAWAFEMTPEGLRLTASVEPEDSKTKSTGKRLDLILAGAAALLVVVIVADRIIPGQSGSGPGGAASDLSLAVLPFADMSPDKDQEYFADGISEELLNVFAKVPELEVAGRTSSFAFKGQNRDIREIGEILNVTHVLEGSVRKSGNRVRITAQLIQASNGYHMWSETYDRELTDIFAVQDEIANAILTEMKPQILGSLKENKTARTDIEAYELYLEAQQHAAQGTIESYQKATLALDKALAIDPDYVPALAWRGYYELMMSDGTGAYGAIPIETALARADAWISKAHAVDPGSADVLFARAGLLSFSPDEGRRKQAGSFYQRALEKKPNFALARNDYGFWLEEQNRREEAVRQFEIALEHDPAQTDANINLIAIYNGRGDFAKSRALIERWLTVAPNPDRATASLSHVAFEMGNLAESYALLKEIVDRRPDEAVLQQNLNEVRYELWDFAALTESAEDPARPFALLAMGRKAEALIVSASTLAQRPDYRDASEHHLTLLYRAGELDAVVKLYDEQYGSLQSVQSTGGTRGVLAMAGALQAGNRPEAAEFIQRAAQALEARKAAGETGPQLLRREAVLLMLQGKQESALALLEELAGAGGVSMTFADPVFAPVRNAPRFRALVEKQKRYINSERATLGWAPAEPPQMYP